MGGIIEAPELAEALNKIVEASYDPSRGVDLETAIGKVVGVAGGRWMFVHTEVGSTSNDSGAAAMDAAQFCVGAAEIIQCTVGDENYDYTVFFFRDTTVEKLMDALMVVGVMES